MLGGSMLRPAAALCSLALLVPTVPAAYAEPSPVQQPESPWRNVQAWETAVVQRVVDGDTVIVNDAVTGAQSRIRLLGINSPA
ncbi:MAG: hypothetical protein ACO3YU_09015, partial [Candidatus Nanopelagicales bacterium]